MTINDFNIAIAKMGIRKNNTLVVGSFVVEKWGANRFKLETRDGKYIGVSGLVWLTEKLKSNGAIK